MVFCDTMLLYFETGCEKMNNSLKGNLIALFTVAVWGTTFINTKVLLNAFTPVEILFTRFILGLIALSIAYPKRLKGLSKKQEFMLAGAGLTGVTLYYLLENIALTLSYASNVGVLVSVSPCITAIFAYFFLKGEKFKPSFFVGFLIAIMGIAIISFNGMENLGLSPKGDILAITACFVWASYSVITKKASEWGINNIQITRRIFTYGTIFMIPFMIHMGYNADIKLILSREYLPSFLYLGWVASAACFATWNVAIKLIGAVKTSIYIYLIPVITTVLSAVILDEKITVLSAVGTALTLIGLVISEGRLDFIFLKGKKA